MRCDKPFHGQSYVLYCPECKALMKPDKKIKRASLLTSSKVDKLCAGCHKTIHTYTHSTLCRDCYLKQMKSNRAT